MSPPSGWQGPVRAAVAVLVVGFLVVWLVKPIGNPCPDLASLPSGSTASSSPSFSPPGARTCTYTVAGGTEARVKHVPWLDWIVLLLLAAAAGGAVRFLSPAGRQAREGRLPPREREPRATRQPKPSEPEPEPERAPRAARQPKPPKPERAPRASAGQEPPRTTERDAADRERARQERAARDRARRGR